MSPSRRTELLLTTILGFLILPANSARADTVILTSGKVLENVQTEEEGDKVVIKRLNGSSVTYPKSMVRSIEKKLTDRQEFEERSRRLPAGDAASRVALAAWCEERQFVAESRKLYEDALALDPNSSDAHRGLGHVQIGEAWHADPAKAIEELEKRGVVGADDLVALWKLSRTNGHKNDAWQFLHRALQTDPTVSGGRKAIAWERNEGVWLLDCTVSRQDEYKGDKLKSEDVEFIVVAFPLASPRYGEAISTLILTAGGAADPDPKEFELEEADKSPRQALIVSKDESFGPTGTRLEGTRSLIFAVARASKGPFLIKYLVGGKAKASIPLPESR